MKYRRKDIDDVFENKNWEGVKPFVDIFGLDKLILLDRIVKGRDWEKLKAFVTGYGIEPLLQYGMPVEGEGVKELFEISDRYHGQKSKTGAEWWVRDEIRDAVRQLQGHAADTQVLEKVALLWKNVDARVDVPGEIKERAFSKVLISSLVQAIYRPEIPEEDEAMKRIRDLFESSGFETGIQYDEEFAE